MSARRRILDDISKLATSAAGLVQGASKEAENAFRHRLESLLDRMDLVPRDEFDVVKEMASKARLENEALAMRIAVLEAKLGMAAPAKKKATRKKATAKKSAAKKTAVKKVTAKKQSAKKSAAKKRATQKSATQKSAAKKSAAKK